MLSGDNQDNSAGDTRSDRVLSCYFILTRLGESNLGAMISLYICGFDAIDSIIRNLNEAFLADDEFYTRKVYLVVRSEIDSTSGLLPYYNNSYDYLLECCERISARARFSREDLEELLGMHVVHRDDDGNLHLARLSTLLPISRGITRGEHPEYRDGRTVDQAVLMFCCALANIIPIHIEESKKNIQQMSIEEFESLKAQEGEIINSLKAASDARIDTPTIENINRNRRIG